MSHMCPFNVKLQSRLNLFRLCDVAADVSITLHILDYMFFRARARGAPPAFPVALLFVYLHTSGIGGPGIESQCVRECVSYQRGQDGQEDGESRRVGGELCDRRHQQAGQQGDGPGRKTTHGLQLSANPH